MITKKKDNTFNSKQYKRKNQPNKYVSKKPIPKKGTPIAIMKNSLSFYGCQLYGEHQYKCGHKVPIYEVSSVHSLSQLIGYAKFINRSYGNVYYRGECKLHDSLIPSLFRGRTNICTATAQLNKLISNILNDSNMKKQLRLDKDDATSSSLQIEGLLQHYGIKTRYLDVVDNHWVALWMGLNRIKTYKQVETYYHYEEREIPLVDYAEGITYNDEDLFQYILLIAVPGISERINNGIYASKHFYEIDLRQALPSTYIRPHAQHGLVIRKRPENGNLVNEFDLASNVVGIIRLRIDRVKQWIGTGALLTQGNLFPAPSFDNGYDILLARTDLFHDNSSIARYI